MSKTKYNHKNKQFGGNINISGPNIIGYFINTKLNKKIIVIGDIHGSSEGKCSQTNSKSITKYIEQINTNYPIDIFIETDIPSHRFLSNPDDKFIKIIKPKYIKFEENSDFISELLEYSYSNYKSEPNKRFHFIDIRYDIIGQESFRNCIKIINMINDKKIKIQEENLGELFHNLIGDYVFGIFQIIQWIEKPDFDTTQTIVPYYLFKEYKKLFESNPDTLDLLIKILSNSIKQFLSTYFRSLENLSVDDIKYIYHLGMNAGAAITDFYTIARIMKSIEFNNCVIYGGIAHYSNLKLYLESIGFELIEQTNSSEENFRCVENIIDFKDFFKSN